VGLSQCKVYCDCQQGKRDSCSACGYGHQDACNYWKQEW
jgi:hypothetical protein